MVAEYLIDRAAFGDHPLGRTVLGPEENLRSFTREGIVAFRERRWAGARGGGVPRRQPRAPARSERRCRSCSRRFPSAAGARRPTSRRRRSRRETLVEQRDTNQSHLRMIYRPDVDVTDVRERAALAIYSTLLGGSMGSRLFDEIREQRGLCYSVYAINHASPTCRSCSSAPASSRPSASRPTRACARSSTSCATTARREEEVQRARAYAAGRLVLSFENTNAVARYAANQQIVFGESIDPDEAIAALDAVTFEEVARCGRRRRRPARRRLRRAALGRGVLGGAPHKQALRSRKRRARLGIP